MLCLTGVYTYLQHFLKGTTYCVKFGCKIFNTKRSVKNQ